MRIFLFFALLLLVGCSQDAVYLASKADLGDDVAQRPVWNLGDFWVIRQNRTINGESDIKFFIYVVKEQTFLNATVPYTAKEDDLNLKALYLRQSKTFQELQDSTPEGDNWISEDVYVLERFQPIKLVPVYAGCAKPSFYQLDFGNDKLTKEFAYSSRDLSLVWDPDIPGRQLKYFHWPLRTGKYWSYPIINTDSVEGQQFVEQKIAAAKEEGFDIEPHEVYSRAMISDYLTGSASFVIDISHLYPFFANYDRNDLTIIYSNESRFWTENYHSDLAGIAINQTQEIVYFGTDFNESFFSDLTPIINYTVPNPGACENTV